MAKPTKPKSELLDESIQLAKYKVDAWIDYHQIKNEKGEPIEWFKHQFLIDIYNDQSDNLVVMKPAQVGLSTLEILKNIRDAEMRKMDIIYTLPTGEDVSQFVGGKVNRIISNNPHIDKLTTDKDTIEQKQIGASMIYFRGCVDKETEILTERGWCKHNEIAIGDNLPTLNIGSHEIEMDKVLNITSFNTEEDMVRVRSSLIDQLITKDHRCVIAKRTLKGNKSVLRIVRAQEMVGKKSAYIPTRYFVPIKDIKPNSFYKIVGWVIGDGSYWTKRDKYKSKVYETERVCIIQSKLCKELEKDLFDSGITYYKKPHGRCFKYELHAKFSRKIRKIIPNKKLTHSGVFSMTQSQRYAVLQGMLMSDGDNTQGTSFWQVKNGNCDALQALLVFLGNTSNKSDIRFQLNRYGSQPQERVRIRKNYWTNPVITTEHYKGIAWCPTTRNGTIFIRRNGKVSVTGQTWTKKSAIMITADRLVHDEKDTSKQDVIADYQSRLQHSKFKQTHVFSHPSVPNSGVDMEWQISDQKEWFITCPHCQHIQILTWNTEDPRKMSINMQIKEFVCKKCGGILDWHARAKGTWRARKDKENAKWSGYHISLLMAPWMTAKEIIDKYLEVMAGKQTMDFFYNKILGLPYAGSGNAVTEDTIKSAITTEKNLYPGRMVIGVDTGLKLRYVYGNKQGLLGYGQMTDYMPDSVNKLALNQTLEYFLKTFPDSIMVIDQGGDIIGPRKLREKYPGRVYLCHYARDRKTMQLIRWGEKEEFGNVLADRNRMIQLLVDEFRDKRVKLFRGRPEDWHEYWLHWSHIYRVKEDDTLGVPRYIWMRSDRDDWVHCLDGDSLITTENGGVKIKDIKVGDFVLTREGFREVEKSGMTYERADVLQATFSNGETLIATPTHRVWMENGGWKQLQHLTVDDILVGICKSLMGRDINSIKARNISLAQSSRGCTEMSGNTTMERYRVAVMSIIRTAIEWTTGLKILNCFRRVNTLPSTTRKESKSSTARFAEKNTFDKMSETTNTAQSDAVQGSTTSDTTKWRGNVSSVKNDLPPILIGGVPHVLNYVRVKKLVALSERRPVYNISVSGEHEYFANGLLVANSTVYWRIGIDRFGGKGGIVGLDNTPEPDSYLTNPDQTVDFDPHKMFGAKDTLPDEPWWAKEEDDWRNE